MSKAIWHCANAAVVIAGLIASIPFLIAAVIYQSWRWVELRAVYGGDADKRDRDEWKGQ
jgi:hypothetical protein